MATTRQQQTKIEWVMASTGCTREAAIAELIAEEWSFIDAIFNIRAAAKEAA